MSIAPANLVDVERFDDCSGDVPEADAEYTEVRCRDVDWSGVVAAGVTFEVVLLQRANLARAKLRSATFRDVSIDRCDWSNVDSAGATIQRVEISATRLTGWNISEGSLRDVVVQGGVAKLAVFHSAKLERCHFENCDLSETTFEGATLRGVTFRNCNLSGVRLLQARLHDVDLRGSSIAGMQIDVTSLRSVTVDPLQTTAIAALTGVAIESLEEE